MARFKKGLLGAPSGAVGSIEGYELNGQLIIRSRRLKSAFPATEKQAACRAKMKLVNQVLSRMAPFVKIGFAGAAHGQVFSPYCAAVAYQMKNAIKGDYPHFEIDYEQLRVSQGTISNIGVAATVHRQEDSLYFRWNAESGYPRSTNHVMILAYSPLLNQAVYNLCGAKRKEGGKSLPLPDGWK